MPSAPTGTTVKDVANLSFTNNTTSGKAGALALDSASLKLTDAQFSNNSAAGWGGAVRLWGNTDTKNPTHSALTLTTTRDLTQAGNKAGQGKTAEKDGSTALGARYEDMGGFAHLQGNSTLTLNAAANTTLTIGETGAAQTAGLDSITTSNGGNTLAINDAGTVNGAGTVNLNGSLEGFVGAINVNGGTVNMATGFGSIDNDTQASVNSQKVNASGATAGNVQSVLTVKSGATVNMGALTINRSTKADAATQAGTQLKVENGGKLYVESITLGTKEYKDKYLATSDEKLASGSLTTTGHGQVDVAADAVAEVKKDVTVAAGTTFDKTNSGAFTVLGTLKTEAAVKDGAKEGAKEVSPAGVFDVKGGTVAVNTVTNAGKTKVASDATFSVTGIGSTNSGEISLLQSGAKFEVQAGADLTNTGTIVGALDNMAYVGDVNVAGKLVNGDKGKIQTGNLTVEDGGYVSTKITDAYAVGKTTVKKGGTFNLTELNSHLDGTAEGAFDQLLLAGGEVELAGGAVTVADKAFTGNVQLGVNKTTPTSYSKATLTISAGEYAADTFTTLPNKTGNDKSTLNVTGGQYTIKTLNANGGAINVAGTGKLVIDTKLSTDSGSEFKISQGGTVETTAAALGLKIGATGVTDDSGSTYASGSITNNGELVLSDLTGITTTKTYLEGIKNRIQHADSKGLLNLGALTISDAVTDGKAQFADVTGSGALVGIASDALSQATVTGVNGSFMKAGSYGKLEAATAAAAATVSGAALTLNGTGDLFTYVSGSETTVKGITLGTSGSLTTTGSANGGAKIGAVLKGDGATGTALTVADNGVLTVSQTDLAPNDQEIKLVNVDTLTIGKGAQLTAGITKAAVAASGQTPATPATYGDIEAGTLNVDGKLDASNSTVTVTSGATFTGDVASTVKTLSLQSGATVSVGTNTAAGKLVVNNVSGNGTIFADPAFVNGVSQSHSTVAVETVSADSTVVAGQNSVVAVGFKDTAAADAAFAKTGFVLADTTAENAPANAVNSVLYVQGTKDANGGHVSATGNFAATNDTSPAQYSSGVKIATGSLLVVDASTVDATYGNTAVFSGAVNVEKGAKVHLANVVNGNTIKLGTSGQLNGDLSYEGDLLLNKSVEQTSGVTVTIKSADLKTLKSEFGDVAGIDAAWGMFDEGANLNNNSKSAAFNKWLYTSTSSAGVVSGDRVDTVRLNKIAADVASLGATTGVQTMTMDAVNQMGETVADRVSLLTQRAAGVNVWAAANGGMFEAKSLFDGAGYESDIYSGVLGVDYQFACNAVLGAALTIGTADTDNKNSTVKASTDSDLVGFSVYASKTFADVLGVSADIGYLTASNDVTANGYGQSWKFSQDTDAFTIGLRTEVLAEVGAVKLVPHIGIRYTALSTDGFEAGYKTEIDDQNIFQMPVGVTVSGDFQTGDWTVAPKFDLSVVPTFGDKDADLKLGITGVKATDDLAVRVIDSNPVQATLGVNATNGAWGFGLNYKLGVGSDDRMNNTFNLNVRYAF